MANPKIQVDLTADAKGLKKGAKEAGDAVEKLAKDADKAAEKIDDAGDKVDASGKKLSGFGDKVGGVAQQHLGPLGEIADSVGIDFDNMDSKVLAAGAGIAAVGAFAAQGVQKFTALADQVRAVSDASGLSFDTSSRLVAVSDDLGISADTVAASMGRLAKNIDAGKLDEYGIAAVRAKDGSVDMAATLGNVADAMNRTADPARRAAIGTALFGKSWADLQPVLQQGGKGIREAFASVSDGQIVTEENAQAVRDWQMALDDAQDAVSELQMAIGKELIPQLAMMAKDFAKVTGAVGDLTGGMVGFTDVMALANPLTQIYNVRLKDQEAKAKAAAESMTGLAGKVAEAGVSAAETGRKTQDLATSEEQAASKAEILTRRQEDVARSAQDAARGVEAQRQQLEQLRGVVETVAGTELGYQRAVMATTDAQADLAEKQKAVTDAVNTYGEAAPEAAAASNDYSKSLLDAQAAADSQAKAEVERARQVAIASGLTFTAEQANLVYRDALVNVRDASNDPNLQGGLSALIGLVDDTAASAGRAQQNLDAAAAAASRLAAAAAGALQVTSQGTFTGSADSAAERIATQRFSAQRSDGGGFETQRSSAPSGGVTFVINHPIGAPNEFIAWTREQLRRAERAQR